MRVEDWHLWIKIYASGRYGMNLGEPLYKMRDDQKATKRRKFRYRLNEAYMSRLAVSTFDLPKKMYLYSLRPIIVGLLPIPLYNYLHRKKRTDKRKRRNMIPKKFITVGLEKLKNQSWQKNVLLVGKSTVQIMKLLNGTKIILM